MCDDRRNQWWKKKPSDDDHIAYLCHVRKEQVKCFDLLGKVYGGLWSYERSLAKKMQDGESFEIKGKVFVTLKFDKLLIEKLRLVEFVNYNSRGEIKFISSDNPFLKIRVRCYDTFF